MKKIMLIGDSIRLSYQPAVAALLAGTATVTGPEENCRFSAYTLFNLEQWLSEGGYDVIQWNNGQWDVCFMSDGRIHTPLETYLEYQKRIISVLRQKARRLIFATITPVWPEQFAGGHVHPRRNEDIVQYNRAAVELMAVLGIEVTDLHTPVAADIKRYICDDMVHLTDDGVALCAGRVVAGIMRNSE